MAEKTRKEKLQARRPEQFKMDEIAKQEYMLSLSKQKQELSKQKQKYKISLSKQKERRGRPHRN